MGALIEREQFYIDTLKPAYNVLKQAGRSAGFKMSDQARHRLSTFHKGRKKTEETRAKMSAYAKDRDSSHLAALSLANTGKRASPAARAKMRQAKLGKPQTDAHKRNSVAARLGAAMSSSNSGVRGVSRCGRRWCARISLNGTYKNLGRFASLLEAEQAVMSARAAKMPGSTAL